VDDWPNARRPPCPCQTFSSGAAAFLAPQGPLTGSQPGYNGPSTYGNAGSYQSSSPDPFYQQQNAAREANMRAVREQQYKNEMQNDRDGYRSTLPNY
jgi:hypothetical protein